jgi:hypothetical protein
MPFTLCDPPLLAIFFHVASMTLARCDRHDLVRIFSIVDTIMRSLNYPNT